MLHSFNLPQTLNQEISTFQKVSVDIMKVVGYLGMDVCLTTLPL